MIFKLNEWVMFPSSQMKSSRTLNVLFKTVALRARFQEAAAHLGLLHLHLPQWQCFSNYAVFGGTLGVCRCVYKTSMHVSVRVCVWAHGPCVWWMEGQTSAASQWSLQPLTSSQWWRWGNNEARFGCVCARLCLFSCACVWGGVRSNESPLHPLL